jgi:hypothetical protein
MSNYTKATNFASKDSLLTGNPLKIVKGTEIDNEFNAIATAISTKFDTASLAGALATPTPIGSGTANSGAFTTLSASSTVSGAGFTTFLNNYMLAPGPIGTTTPSGGRFTFAHTAPVVATQVAGAITIDCSLSNVFTTTITQNITTPTFSNLKDGQTINWFITQNSTGGPFTVTWASSNIPIRWPGGSAAVLSTAANAVDLVVLTYRAGPNAWYATFTLGFA